MKSIFSAMMAVVFVMGMAGAARADGKELFGKRCAGCHGKDGKAQTSIGKKLNIKDLTDPKVQAGATDAQWEKIVLEGYKAPDGKMVMPAIKVSPEEAKDLVKVCRSFKK